MSWESWVWGALMVYIVARDLATPASETEIERRIRQRRRAREKK